MALRLFALEGSEALGARIGAALGHDPDPHEDRAFEDGERKTRPLAPVRGTDAYVVAGLHGGQGASPNDRLCRLLFFLATLRTNGAARVTPVIPYLAYARKDRQTKARDPLTARYVAQLLEAAGADRMVAMEVHNLAAIQNAFRIETVALDTRPVLGARAAGIAGDAPVAVAAPDPGGVKRAQLFREALEARLGREVGFALMEKRRSAGVVSGTLVAGDVEGARVLVVDDMIASGGTMVRAGRACRDRGALSVHALAAHGLFTGDAGTRLAGPALDGTVVTDTVPPFRIEGTPAEARIEVVGAAPILAEAIRRLHAGRSVAELTTGI